MRTGAKQFFSFACFQMKIDECGEGLFIHGLNALPQVVRRAVRRNEPEPVRRELRVQGGDVLRPDQVEDLLRLAFAVPVRGEHVPLQHHPQMIPAEHVLDDGKTGDGSLRQGTVLCLAVYSRFR